MEEEEGLNQKEIWESLCTSPLTTANEVRAWIVDRGLDVQYKTKKCVNSVLFPFMISSATPHWKEISLLLLKHGVDINHTNNDGNTALTIACQYGYFEQVLFLFNNGANIFIRNNAKVTPLMFACYNRHDYEQIIPFLIEKGASLDDRDDYKRRPLEWAEQTNWPVLEIICRYY